MSKNNLPDSLLDFNMTDAQELVDVYVSLGRYIQALRLLRCMKEKAALDIEMLRGSNHVSESIVASFIEEEFLPCIDRQSEEIRKKLRSGI